MDGPIARVAEDPVPPAIAQGSGALAAIGDTPLVPLDRLHPGPGRIVAKAEFLQPGGSIKDRVALYILRAARAGGELVPGQPVVEMTSGNMGAGLAVVCNVMGHPLTVTMSAGNSPERAHMLRQLGAEVVLVEQVDGAPGRVTGADIEAAAEEARRIARDGDGFFVDQFNNPGTVAAHEHGTGPELWRALDGRLSAFVAAVGTGGTFVGASRYLKRCRPDVVCVAVEPAGAAVLAGEPIVESRHLLQGTGYGSVPPMWDAALMDLSIAITDDEATRYRHRLAVEEGLHVGFSAAANVAACERLLSSGRVPADATVATVLCDTGFKYG